MYNTSLIKNTITSYEDCSARGEMGWDLELSCWMCIVRDGIRGRLDIISSVTRQRVIRVTSLIVWMCGMRV